jgi:hypothetical protein
MRRGVGPQAVYLGESVLDEEHGMRRANKIIGELNMATTPQKRARHSDATVTEPLPGWLAQTDEALQELLRLPPNWNSYGARPISPDNVRAAKDLLRAIVQPDTPRPSVVPTVGGGVRGVRHLHPVRGRLAFLLRGHTWPVSLR